ncbi:MAG: Holliday junction resolvase RuvX [Kineosporiaceae bacterium]|nr:Holliday junction resolvase RuvX [Kineosporiaceae bacterium]
MRRGVRLAVDVGTVRVGIARSDPDGLLAVPECTLTRSSDAPAPGGADLDRIVQLVADHQAIEVVVGLPLSLSGAQGPAAAAARGYAEALSRRVDVGVRLVDERLSTVTATRSMREAGRKGRRVRPVIDQAAAVVILQAALDAERASGRPPGVPVCPTGVEGDRGRSAGESGADGAEASPT